jgi:hypothetical protein
MSWTHTPARARTLGVEIGTFVVEEASPAEPPAPTLLERSVIGADFAEKRLKTDGRRSRQPANLGWPKSVGYDGYVYACSDCSAWAGNSVE